MYLPTKRRTPQQPTHMTRFDLPHHFVHIPCSRVSKNTYSYSCHGSSLEVYQKFHRSFWELCGWITRCLLLTICTKGQGNNYLEICLEVSQKFPGSFPEAYLRNVAMGSRVPKVIKKQTRIESNKNNLYCDVRFLAPPEVSGSIPEASGKFKSQA